VSRAFPQRVPVLTSIPCFSSERRSAADTSASSAGNTAPAISTSVTRLPSVLKSHANSTPTAPAPATITEAGNASNASASRDVSTRFPPPRKGSGTRGRQPVATRIFSARNTSVAPSAPVTSTLPGAATRPVPARSATPCFFSRNPSPAPSRATTSRDRAAIRA
jgi:hypothetical protein